MNNSEEDPRLFTKEIDPIHQGLAVISAAIVFNVLFWIFEVVGIAKLPDYQAWAIAMGMLLFFALFNTVLSLGSKNVTRYWSRSIYTYVGICVIGGLIAWAFSGMGLSGNASIRWLYFVMTFVYLLFLSIVNMMRMIVTLAQKVDKDLRGESD